MDLYTHLNHICIHKMTKKQYGKFAFLPFFSAGQRLNDWSPESFLHSSLSPLPACIKPLHYSQGRLCIMTSLPHVSFFLFLSVAVFHACLYHHSLLILANS